MNHRVSFRRTVIWLYNIMTKVSKIWKRQFLVYFKRVYTCAVWYVHEFLNICQKILLVRYVHELLHVCQKIMLVRYVHEFLHVCQKTIWLDRSSHQNVYYFSWLNIDIYNLSLVWLKFNLGALWISHVFGESFDHESCNPF